MQEKIDIIQAALERISAIPACATNIAEYTTARAQAALTTLQDLEKDLASEEMVEKVAKSIWDECQGISYCGKTAYNVDPTKEEARQLAKAAIKTILGN